MYAKSLVFGFAMVISLLPAGTHAQNLTANNAFENIDTSVLPDGSIVVISKEETGMPGYLHTRYAFVDQACGPQMVDRYGPPVDPNDKDLQQFEQRMCRELAMNSRDGD